MEHVHQKESPQVRLQEGETAFIEIKIRGLAFTIKIITRFVVVITKACVGIILRERKKRLTNSDSEINDAYPCMRINKCASFPKKNDITHHLALILAKDTVPIGLCTVIISERNKITVD